MELTPSELFGHKKGAFTSAIEDKTGFFREADGGTLFLDEGNFREDLYHRLNEFMIKVPSLRECADDIPSCAGHFREEANRELRRQ